MSSRTPLAERTGDTPTTGHDGGGSTARTSAAPAVDFAATPIYDELAARFGLGRPQEFEGRRDGGTPARAEESAGVEPDQRTAAMRPAC